MVSVDPFFVPTRSSLGKNISHKIVNFQNRQIVRTHPKINKISNPNSIQQIDMKKARFEVYKFAHSALHGEEKQKSNIQLAIKLGAKPPKKPYKNYKVLKEELQKELKEDKEKQKLYNIPVKHRISTHKSKLNKGTLRRKRKIGSGILNVYGKVVRKNAKKMV